MKCKSLLLLLLVVIFGCDQSGPNTDKTGASGAAGATSETALARIKREGKLVVAYANEEPFGYLDLKSNRVTGEAPEIARVICQKMGVEEVEPVLTEWAALIPGLKAGRYDCVAAGMYITPERAANVIFSNPTYRIGEAFLVKKGNPKKLHGFEDIVSNKEAKLGFVTGTVEKKYADAMGVPESQTVTFSDNNAAVAGLKAGQIDAFVGTALTVQTFVNKLGPDADVERAQPFKQPVIDGKTVYGYGAFAFRPEDTQLRDAFNQILKVYLGTPEHKQLVAPFGFLEPEMTGGITADEVLGKAKPAPEAESETEPEAESETESETVPETAVDAAN